MSKKILSAVLAIAMVVSLCASLFTVSTSAASDYEADRAALKDAIVELFVKGPSVDNQTIAYLKDTGVISNKDVKDREKVFDVSYDSVKSANEEHLTLNIEVSLNYFVKGTWFNQADYEAMLEKAATAYYFGQDADLDKVDPSFNAGRNEIVEEQTAVVESWIAKFLAEVGAENDKPSEYAADYKEWREYYHAEGLYNPNYGINPFDGDLADLFGSMSNWEAILQGYVGFPSWFTFAELRADATTAKLLNVFERLYRAAQTDKVAGIWYYDFVIEKVAPLDDAWDALREALVGNFKFDKPVVGSVADEIKAYNNLVKVVEFYDYYIVDAYLNIYTSTSNELLFNVALAKKLMEFVKDETGAVRALYVAGIGSAYLNNLKDAIVTGIAALDPAAASLALTDAEIAEGVDLVNKASALLNGYASFKNSGTESYRNAYAALASAIADLKVMLPYDANSYAYYTIEANTSAAVKDINGEDVKANDKIIISFVPNFFAFSRYYVALEDALVVFAAVVDDYNSKLGNLPGVSSSVALAKKALSDILGKYDYLIGWNYGNSGDSCLNFGIEVVWDASKPAWIIKSNDSVQFSSIAGPYVKEFYAQITGTDVALGGSITNDDAAYNQYVTFKAMFEDASKVYTDGPSAAAASQYYNDIKFVASTFDWETGEFSAEANGYAKVAERLVGFLPYLMANVEQIANLYGFVAVTLAEHFGIIGSNNADLWQNADSYVDGAYEEASIAFLSLAGYLEGFDIDIPDVLEQTKEFTVVGLTNSYNNFIKEVKDLTTDLGDSLIDTFIAKVWAWIATNYYDKYGVNADLFEDLVNRNMGAELKLYKDGQIYDCYDFTLKAVSELNIPNNIYYLGANGGAMTNNMFVENIYKPLNTFNSLYNYDASGYDRAWVEEMSIVRTLAGHVLNNLSLVTGYEFYYLADESDGGGIHDNGYGTFAWVEENGVKIFIDDNGNKLQYLKKDGTWDYIRWGFQYTEGHRSGDWDCYCNLKDSADVRNLSALTNGQYPSYTGSFTKNGCSGVDSYGSYLTWVYDYYCRTLGIVSDCRNDVVALGAIPADYDVTLSYVLKLIDAIDEVVDNADEHTVAAVAAFKAAELEPAIEAASGKSMYDYAVDTEAGKAAWAAYEKAYAKAIKDQYDARVCTVEIAETIDALEAAVAALNEVAKEETGATAADLEAAIADATALLAKADELDTEEKVAAVEALKAAIDAAKAFIVDLKYNTSYISYDISKEVAKVETAMDKVNEELTFADDLVAFLTYTAGLVEDVNGSESAYAAFVAAYEAATAVAANEDLKASEYAAAANSVLAAYEALVASEPEFSKTYEAAVAKLAELKAVVTDGYTAESVAAFEAAVAALEAGINEVADDDALIELIANAYIAKADLAVKNVETCDD
ncbi:MAG: hypothetical protein IJP09_00055 [Clostridia bacterium]|nr:hypothetical protein [Clostridia bacterium]